LKRSGIDGSDDVTLVHLPAYALDPIENVREYLRGNKLYDDIVDKTCAAWNFFADDPKRIASITHTIMGDGQSLGRLV
jgi:hypothetical protein